MEDFQYDKDAQGIVTVTMDMVGQAANRMNENFVPAFDKTLDRLRSEAGLTGVIFTSAKKTFFAGGDLELILKVDKSDAQLLRDIEDNKRPYRELEKLQVPVVAAINGAAVGIGYELCLACNYRVVVDKPHAVVGLPEVTLGLLPGSGGVVRLTALIGLEAAAPLLTEGVQLKPEKALAAGLVDEIVEDISALIPAAKAWIQAHPDAHTQPWDKKGFRYPGGNAEAPRVRQVATMGSAMLVSKTRGLLPAPEVILDVAVNSMRMNFDQALRVESRGICKLITTPECKAAITTFFFGMQAIKSGKVRPAGELWKASSSAVLGSGMMGSGIAWAHANRGLSCVLKDTEISVAENGKGYSAELADKRIKRGLMTEPQKDKLLSLIVPATEDSKFEGTDLIIEAVYEDLALKETVIPETFAMLSDDGVYGSNTSTLPISLLAQSCPDPGRFIGLHFFSPVDKMKVVEIILGEKTSETTLRKAYDYVQQIGYMPIVVNDSRGFFTSRVFGTYLDEGQQLLLDGMNPVAIERAAWIAGMPVGPLAVHDEVSLVLSKKVYDTHVALDNRLGIEKGFPADISGSQKIAFKLVEMGRGGRQYGGGFYDYHDDGSKTLWKELNQFQANAGSDNIDIDEAVDRLLYRQAIETLCCLDEGVLRTEIEANLGGIYAIGFPAHTGGALQFIRGIGIDRFQVRCAELASTWGDRFVVTDKSLDTLRRSIPVAA